jgi:hypothetical protein
MSRTRTAVAAVAWLLCAVAALAYLRDPPWLSTVTFGMRDWEEDSGVRFRWTGGHAAFYVPADATRMVLPIRVGESASGRTPLRVTVSVDDAILAVVTLDDPMTWSRAVVLMPPQPTGRHVRRVDVRVPRTTADMNYGVQVGEPELVRGTATGRVPLP